MQEINFVRLGQIIANARRRCGYQGEQVARAVGIHPVSLSRIEHGKLPGMSVALLTRLALHLDISLDFLVDAYPGKKLKAAITQAMQQEQQPPPATQP